MAAYAALVSVMNIIETIQNHPRPPISFHKEQLQSLTQNITFLQQFLETHSIDDGFEGRIADAAYAAEDVIESQIVDHIYAFSEEEEEEEEEETPSYVALYNGLHKVIQDLDLIQRDACNFTEETGLIRVGDDDQLQPHNNQSMPGGQANAVGIEDVLVQVMDKLTGGGHHSNRQIIPIVGMGGIGKTTLASNLYVNPVVVEHFDFRGWATVSQEYSSKEILLQVLVGVKTMGGREGLSQKSKDELGDALYKSLFGRRYLIVLDDMWSIEAWDRVKAFFPDTGNGSAIVVTTRLFNLAFQLSGSCDDKIIEMSFLDADESWDLFCKTTFGEESSFPLELQGFGMQIVENCVGLPLSIVAIGGLLAKKSKQTREYWKYIAGNLNSVVNLTENERCLKILHLSYKELPVHLKPCFLYMGVFPEDFEIRVPKLMDLWVAEGFLKPVSGKCLEEVAEEYFNDLVGRNLVFVAKLGKSGKAKSCVMHDLLLDVCIREAQKHKFLHVARCNDDIVTTPRRVAVHDLLFERIRDRFGLKKKSNDRTARIWNEDRGEYEMVLGLPDHLTTRYRSVTFRKFPGSLHSELVRVWNEVNDEYGKRTAEMVPWMRNCRYLSELSIERNPRAILSSLCLLWNLQRLHVDLDCTCATSVIWKMSQLRHVKIEFFELLEPNGSGNEFVLRNLRKLSSLNNFKFSEEAVKRIPNIKKLKIWYKADGSEEWSSYCLGNLVQLIKLESLLLSWDNGISSGMHLENLSFPRSLNKLTLRGTNLGFGDLGPRIGSLPHLQVLKLGWKSFVGPEWETVEGHFRNLKHLSISGLKLERWNTESCTHFPCLESLFLEHLGELKEIPSEIGETLISIEMRYCCDSANNSARKIVDEQEELGNEGIHLEVIN